MVRRSACSASVASQLLLLPKVTDKYFKTTLPRVLKDGAFENAAMRQTVLATAAHTTCMVHYLFGQYGIMNRTDNNDIAATASLAILTAL